jgi:hypothetical protein
VAALTAAGAGAGAMTADLGALADAVSGVGGLDIVFVADPSTATKMMMNVGPRFSFPILASKSLAAKTVMAIALPALCAVLNPTPQITVSSQAAVQLDNAPAAGGLVDGSSTVATNVRSAWQTDSIFIRFVADIAWALRADGACAWMQGCNW